MRKKTIIRISLLVLIPTIFILLIMFTNNKLSQCGRDPYNFYAETELAKAVYRCKYEKVKKLVNQGADINSIEGDDVTPLHLIVHQLNIFSSYNNNNCVKTLKLLLESGINVNAQDIYGETPLHHTKNLDIMNFLLKAKADPNIKNNEGRTPLHYHTSIYSEDESYIFDIELLLQYNAKIDIKDNNGNSPLSIARDRKLTKILKLFNKHKKKQQSGTGEI